MGRGSFVPVAGAWLSGAADFICLSRTDADVRPILAIAVCFLLAACSAAGQSLRLSGSRVVFPDGDVLDAAFLNGQIFVQEAVLRSDGPNVVSARRVLAWNPRTRSVVAESSLGDARWAVAINDCGRVAAESAIGRILVCGDSRTLISLSAETLGRVSEIRCPGRVFDFVVDDTEKTVFVAWQSDSGVQYLTAFDILSGRRGAEVQVSSGVVAGAHLALDPRTERIAIAQSVDVPAGYATNLFACGYSPKVRCERVAAALGQTSQIAILGQEVLLASGLLANDRHVCLTGVDLTSKWVTHEYCAPQTGIHYGVGAVDQRYVVGYSGVQKWMAWKEGIRNGGSSVSVWRYEDARVAAQARQDDVPPSFSGGARIAGTGDSPEFLLFSQTSNVAFLYSLEEMPGGRSR